MASYSYYHPATQPQKQRPQSVTVASALLFATVPLAVVGAIASFTTLSTVRSALVAIDASDASTQGATGFVIIFGVAAIVAALMLGLFAFLVRLPRQGLRVTSIVALSIGLLCTGCGGGYEAVVGLMGGYSATDTDPDIRALATVPTWFFGITAALEAITFVLILVAIVLISQRAAGAYYRNKAAVGAMTYAGYGYPATGYPTTGYPASAYPEAGYPAPGYPTPGYPTAGYPTSGAAWPTQPATGWPIADPAAPPAQQTQPAAPVPPTGTEAPSAQADPTAWPAWPPTPPATAAPATPAIPEQPAPSTPPTGIDGGTSPWSAPGSEQ